jgi:hypothetical protein
LFVERNISAHAMKVSLGAQRKAALSLATPLIFTVLLTAIVTRPPKWLSDFDQSFYLTIAYDIRGIMGFQQRRFR